MLRPSDSSGCLKKTPAAGAKVGAKKGREKHMQPHIRPPPTPPKLKSVSGCGYKLSAGGHEG